MNADMPKRMLSLTSIHQEKSIKTTCIRGRGEINTSVLVKITSWASIHKGLNQNFAKCWELFGINEENNNSLILAISVLAPKFLGSVLCACTNIVVRSHSIVLHAPKEMHKELYNMRNGPSFVSRAPRLKTTKCAPVQVLSSAPKNKKMPTGIKKGIIEKSP
jgi:hypothetical protein